MKAKPGRTVIGNRMVSVRYIKGQKHACDPACRAAGHLYEHKYKKPIPFVAGGRGEVRAPARLYTRRDGTVEPYAVDNPPLLIVNGPTSTKRSKSMATYKMKRNAKGRFVAIRNAPRKKKKSKSRRNPPFWTAGALVNSPKHHKRRRRTAVARRNPPRTARVPMFFGIPLVMPEIPDVLAITGGLAGPPMIKGFAMQLLPASVTTSTAGKYGIEAGSYIIPPIVGYMLGGRRALKNVLAGEAAAVGVRLLGQLTAQISASISAAQPGAMPIGTVAGYLPRGNALTKANGLGGRLGTYMPQGTRMLNAYADSRNSSRAQSRFTGRRTR